LIAGDFKNRLKPVSGVPAGRYFLRLLRISLLISDFHKGIVLLLHNNSKAIPMKPFSSFFTKLLFITTLFVCQHFSIVGQTNYSMSDKFYTSYSSDSLTEACEKFDDGCYTKGLTVNVVPGVRVSISYSAYGPAFKDLSLRIRNGADKMVIHYSDLMLDSRSGTIYLDTTFDATDTIAIFFTTVKPGETFNYSATVLYASPDAMTWHEDASFCWKINYVINQSENGFKFIKGESSGALFNPFEYKATTEIKPGFSFIEAGVGSIYYHATIGRGTKEQAEATFSKATGALMECLSGWEFENSTDDKGMQHFTATKNASTEGQDLRNLSYIGKKDNELPKYHVYLYVQENDVDGKAVSYDLVIQVVNDFYQY
jgi:hypothetical protein